MILKHPKDTGLWGLFLDDDRNRVITWEWSGRDMWWWPQVRVRTFGQYKVWRAGWLWGAIGFGVKS